jgi:hypothetical protein
MTSFIGTQDVYSKEQHAGFWLVGVFITQKVHLRSLPVHWLEVFFSFVETYISQLEHLIVKLLVPMRPVVMGRYVVSSVV